MEVIERLILENGDKEAKRKLKLADYLYREIENDENAEQLEELVSLLVEVLGGDNSVKKSASRQFESEVMDAFYRYLLNSGKTEKTSYDYCMRLVGIFKSLGISIEDLFNGRADVQYIIDLYSKGGDRYDENVQRHNGPSSALKQFKKFLCDIERYPGGTPKDPTFIPPVHDDDGTVRRNCNCNGALADINEDDLDDAYIYLHDIEGYTSFESMAKHCCEIEIINRNCTVKFKENRMICDTVTKVLNDRNYADLIRIMRYYYEILNEKTEIASIGSAEERRLFEYKFGDKSNFGTCALFDSDDRALLEIAYKMYNKVIMNIVNQ